MAWGFESLHPHHLHLLNSICGSSSVVEYNLAKVGVAGSSPVFRSIYTAGVVELADTQDLKSCGW
jgi:hypothetical protein